MVFPPLPVEFAENHSAVIATSSFESNDDTVIDVELSAETAWMLLFKSFVVGKELATYKSSYSITVEPTEEVVYWGSSISKTRSLKRI